MVRTAVIGLGKMGISHLAITRAHPNVELVAVCDPTTYVLDALSKYTNVKVYPNYRKLFDAESPDAIVIATPPGTHAEIVRAALERNINVFCEKPFSLNWEEGNQLAKLASTKGLVNQVGYHYRFVGAFREMKRIIESNVLGKISHIRAEAYGPVVLRPTGSNWRSSTREGGGCLYDYACHGLDLVNYLVGPPVAIGGVALNKIFSRDVEDEVYATLYFANGVTGQIAANWSDESFRKMSMKISVWGTNGRASADRQEVQLYLRDASDNKMGFREGWNIRYTTELSEAVWFYVRGEEYSAEIDHFIKNVESKKKESDCSFAHAVETDMVVAAILSGAESPRTAVPKDKARAPESDKNASRVKF
jgi:predicted dehydrogenase